MKKQFILYTTIYMTVVILGIIFVYAFKPKDTPDIDIGFTKNVSIKHLDNGATIILKHIPDAQVSSVQTFIKTGSINEGKYLGYGLSHCIEHMLFKGTDKYKVGQVSQSIRNIGGQLNAYTSFERTVFHITVPSENTVSAMSIMANAVLHSTFDANELQKEKKVIEREMAMDNDNPDRAVSDFLFEQTFSRLPYHYPVIGYKHLFEQIKRKNVMEYYRRRYKPENLVFVCVGKFDEDAIIKSIQKEFQTYHYYPMANVDIPEEPYQLSFHYAEKRKPNIKLTRVNLAWKTVPLRHPDLYALDVLSIILGAQKTSVLYKTFFEKLALVEAISAWSYTPGYTGVFTIEAKLQDENLSSFTNRLFQIINSIPSYVNSDQLKLAKNKVLKGYIDKLQTVQGQASELGLDYITAGSIDFAKQYVEGIQSVTKQDIIRVYKKYFHKNNLTMVALRPVVKSNANKQAISTRVTNTPQKVVLENGLKVVYVQKKDLPLITLKYLVKGGLLLDEKPGLGNFVSRMITRNTKKYKKSKIFSVIERAGGSLSTYSANNSAGVSVSILDKNIDTGLDVLSQVVMLARFSKKDIDKVRSDILSDIKSQDERIFSEGGNILRSIMYSNHPYRYNKLGNSHSVSNITQDDLKRFYKTYYSVQNSVLVVVGNITPVIRKRIEKKFSVLPHKKEGIKKYKNLAKQKSHRIYKTVQKEQSLLLLSYPILSVTNQSRYELEVLSKVLSGLGSRLFVSLRDTQHLCYYVGGYPNFYLDKGFFLFYIGTEGKNLLNAEKGLFREVQKIKQLPITQTELNRAKNDLIGKYKSEAQSYDSLALSLGLFELYYNDYNEYYQYITNIQNISIQDVFQVSKHIFNQPYKEVLLKGVNDE